jgi:peptidoglycan hydrolase-like protein with peptidoglycan-binding domain
MSDWLSGCTKQDFGTSGGSWTRQPAIIVVHSTEGMGWPGYDGGQSAPHFTINVTTGERRQHISMGVAARALMNPSGGVETNRAGAIQIETIGTCDPKHKGDPSWLYLPLMSPAAQANLARLMRDIANDRKISWTCGVTFKAYPGSYGTGNGVRLSGSSWNSYKGVLGHQHVPENDHGDPGDIPIAKIMGITPAPQPPQPTPPPAGKAPAFPYPSSDYLGTTRSDPHCHSGYYASDQPNIRTWQHQMAARGWSIGVDGLYGPESESVCRQFQSEKGLAVDGLVGPNTWSKSWTAPVT